MDYEHGNTTVAKTPSPPARIAERAGFDHSYMSRLECGARMPTRDAVLRIAEALGASKAETATLEAAAGFLPDDIAGLLPDEPLAAALFRALRDAARSDKRKAALRQGVEALLTLWEG